jgi:hypothetical protein
LAAEHPNFQIEVVRSGHDLIHAAPSEVGAAINHCLNGCGL